MVGQDRRRDREVILDLSGLLPPESRTVPVELWDPGEEGLAVETLVRVWDLATGQPIGQPLTGHSGWVNAVACTVLEDRPVPGISRAVAATKTGQLVCTFGNDLAVFSL